MTVKATTLKVMGEGGAHAHRLETPIKTAQDGMHKHLFFVFERLIMTLLDGAHSHSVDPNNNSVGAEDTKHKHKIVIATEDGNVELDTLDGDSHQHELQTGGTTLSGLHQHILELGGEKFLSLLPGDLIGEIEAAAKAVKAFKDFKIKKSNDPMEMDFELVKRINQTDFRAIMKTAVERTHLKTLSLGDGLQIESLILSRDRFSDIGVARRFVMDHGLQVKASEELPLEGVFTFQIRSRDRFFEATLQRITISDGVEAVIGFMRKDEDEESEGKEGQEVEAAEPVQEGEGSDAFTENASEPEQQEDVASADLEPLKDGQKRRHEKKPKKVKTQKSKTNKFIFLKTNKELDGTVAKELQQIANNHDITRKFVTVEYPEKRFVEVLTTEKFEVISATYAKLGEHAVDDESEGQEYDSLHVKNDHLEAFIIKKTEGYNSKSLVIFFDDEKHLDEIFKTEVKNYEFGVYQYKSTMMGPILVGVDNDITDEPILDEELLSNLKRDTKLFFSKKSEDFFAGKNQAKKKMPYKRGVLMYGPPGNGKTTFIKYYGKEHVEDGYVVLCEPQDFDGSMGKFLKQRLGKDANKIIVFEDVDAIADSYYKRAEFLNFLDGVNTIHKTLFIATTNYPHMLDSALIKRPSRFDQKYYIGLPDADMRKKFLESFFKETNPTEINQAVGLTEDFSGAMFKEVFILTGLQDISIAEAIEKMRSQMEIRKANVQPLTLESIADLVWTEFLEPTLDSIMNPKEKSMGTLKDKFDRVSKLHVPRKKRTTKTSEIEIVKRASLPKNLITFNILQKNLDKGLVTGAVLIPDVVDLQGDIIDKEEIEKAIHNYMVKLAFQKDIDFLSSLGLNANSKRGFMHTEFNRKIAFVEMFVVNDDRGFMMMNKEKVMNGTAMGTAKIFDDEVKALVRSGKITGFSIGGRSKVIPLA